jgi:molybdopterin converting factor small subunit
VITVRYFAGARAAAGTSSEQVRADSLAELLTGLTDRHGDPLGRVLGVASFLVDGVAAHDHGARLRAGCTVDVLPPFAGG